MSTAARGRVGLSSAQTLGFAVLYLLLAVLGRSTVLPGASVSLVWPAAGVAVLWLLLEHPRRQGRVLAVIAGELFAVLLLTGAPVPLALTGVISTAIQTWLAVALVRRWCPTLLGADGDDSVHSPRVLVNATVAVLISSLVGACISWAGLVAIAAPLSAPAVVLLWGRQVVGILAVASVGHLGWEWFSGRADPRADRGGRREFLVLWGSSLAGLGVILSQRYGLLFLFVPLSVWCASRFTTFAAVTHATTLGTLSVAFTINGHGPLTEFGDPYAQAMMTQLFLLALLMTSLAVGTLRDSTDDLMRQVSSARAYAEEQTALLSGMTETMEEGLLVLDESGRVTQHNTASLVLAQRYRPGDDKKALRALVRVLDRAAAAAHASGRGELGPGDVVIPLYGGGEMIVAVTTRPVDADVDHPGYSRTLLVLHEVTAHRLGFRPLVEFAATTAHDLRGPLTVMRTWLSLIRDEPEVVGNPDAALGVDRLDRSVTHMSSLIDDLLTHATAQAGPLAPEDVVLVGVVAHVVELTGAGTSVSVPTDLPPVHADPGAIRQLFANLIGNGIKYALPDGRPKLEVSAEVRGARVVIDVRDHGLGVAPEERERIFERFHRVSSISTSHVGTGLGLSLCRTIVERHGGEIECVEPEDGHGAIFRFDLPAARSDIVVGSDTG